MQKIHHKRIGTVIRDLKHSRIPALVACILLPLLAVGQQNRVKGKGCSIHGIVLENQKPAAGAIVTMEKEDESAKSASRLETRTDAAGSFAFSNLRTGAYRLVAEKAGLKSAPAEVAATPSEESQRIELNLETSGAQTAAGQKSSVALPMQFADKPNFAVAGITDWTAVGGHGSDSILRTSEALARKTLTLRPPGNTTVAPEPSELESELRDALSKNPNSFQANRQLGMLLLKEGRFRGAVPFLAKAHDAQPADDNNSYDLVRAYEGSNDLVRASKLVDQLLVHDKRAEVHRLAGDIDEKLGKPLSAVREYEQATRLDPTEENYFAWGSELLYHRAIWQALEVFRQGEKSYPKSSRMLTALGSAQFAGALYDKAAISFCAASDMHPENPTPYSFIGEVDAASPDPLPCVESRLERFAGEHPESALANYLYAMAILKREQLLTNAQAIQQAQMLLEKAAALNPSYGEAYLQLGIIAYSKHNITQAIGYYKQAIAAKPRLADSYFRLGVAYDRLGKPEDARREFQLHEELEKQEAAAVDAQRRKIKQFMIVQNSGSESPVKH